MTLKDNNVRQAGKRMQKLVSKSKFKTLIWTYWSESVNNSVKHRQSPGILAISGNLGNLWHVCLMQVVSFVLLAAASIYWILAPFVLCWVV